MLLVLLLFLINNIVEQEPVFGNLPGAEPVQLTEIKIGDNLYQLSENGEIQERVLCTDSVKNSQAWCAGVMHMRLRECEDDECIQKRTPANILAESECGVFRDKGIRTACKAWKTNDKEVCDKLKNNFFIEMCIETADAFRAAENECIQPSCSENLDDELRAYAACIAYSTQDITACDTIGEGVCEQC
jgi:hypothetical protein